MEAEVADDREKSPQPDSEGEGDDLRPGNKVLDSSDEESEGSEAERQVREGFIVDEEDEERRNRRKRKHKRRPEDEDLDIQLDEDDLDLIGQGPSQASKFKRLRRFRDDSPGSDDLDRDDSAGGHLNIFDDDDGLGAPAYADDLDDFIELDPEEQALHDAAKQSKSAGAAQRSQAALRGVVPGLPREAFEDIQEIFGTGDEYAWAMELEDDEQARKKEPNLQDVFEPSILQERFMTAEDDQIRAADVPERMQMLSTRYLGKESPYGRIQALFAPEEMADAARWIAPRINDALTQQFLGLDAQGHPTSSWRANFLDAVERVLDEMHTRFRDVPFIWTHRRDYLTHIASHEHPSVVFLERPHVWRIQQLSYEYRLLLDREHALQRLWARLGSPADAYFADYFGRIDALEDAADLLQWIHVRFSKELARLRQQEDDAASVDAAAAAGPGQKFKRAQRVGAFQRAKDSPVAALAEEMAIEPRLLIQALSTDNTSVYKDDPALSPLDYAEQFAVPNTPFPTADHVVAAAKTILIHEMAADPYLRKEIRRLFLAACVLNIRPTEKGRGKIDKHHPYYAFKWVANKPLDELKNQPNFLAMLAAEAEELVVLDFAMRVEQKRDLERRMERIYLSDFTSVDAQAWNGLRADVLKSMLDEHVLPSAVEWLRKSLKDGAEAAVLEAATQGLEVKAERAPYASRRMSKGDTPAVVAVSFGAGDPRRDSVVAVFLDRNGRFRDQITVDSIVPYAGSSAEPAQKQAREDAIKAFQEFLVLRKPDVVVVGGFSFATKQLFKSVEVATEELEKALAGGAEGVTLRERRKRWREQVEQPAEEPKGDPETIYVDDSTARLYQHSKRASDEFPQLSTLAKYCVGLARYTQSPINEYTALGNQLTSLTFHTHQKYIDEDKLRTALQQALVNVVNDVGVDINKAVRDPYYCTRLPFVGGLGPRKAQGLIRSIRRIGDTLVTRQQMLDHMVAANVFMSCSAFLKIDQEFVQNSGRGGEDGPDVLDSTRIHTEDYDIARKMASDAVDLDEEDIAALSHPSEAVRQLLDDDPAKVNELQLDNFAIELQRLMGIPKRYTLYFIRQELLRPFGEMRTDFKPLSDAEAFRQISGELPESLNLGLVVPVIVVRPPRMNSDNGSIKVRLESGVEGIVESGYFDERAGATTYTAGQALRALVTELQPKFIMTTDEDVPWYNTLVKLDVRPASLASGEFASQTSARQRRDPHFDYQQEALDAQTLEAAKKKAAGRQRRLIQHRNFHNFNAGQAEHYLSSQPRGDCVIRPSSLGTDHLACTWKVAEGIYAHLQITELNKPDNNPLALGGLLQIGGKYKYSDLDELMHSHIRSMANKVEEMLAHDKFKGTEEELLTFLRNFQMANPELPAYGFSIDKKHPGQFNLTFIGTKGGQPQHWPVKVLPGAFKLFEAEVPDVRSLCNAFKLQIGQLRIQRGSAGAPPSRTPYAQGRNTPAGRQTPAAGRHTPAGRQTPMHTGYGPAPTQPYASLPFR